MSRLKLLPQEPFARLAYFWLIYLAWPAYFAFGAPFAAGRHSLAAPATILALAIFLPLYFVAYWLRGGRALLPIALMAMIGILLLEVNVGASVFFVYAGSFAHRVGRPRVAAQVLGAILSIIVVDFAFSGMVLQTFAWTMGITALVGGMTIYSDSARRRMLEAQAESRRLAIVAERERIGRDLHDLLGHTLSVIALKSELASRLGEGAPERAFSEIRDVERISREALSEVRRAIRGWNEPIAFEDELKRARLALDAAGVALTDDIAPIALDAAVSQTLAFLLREAVTNVIRHAHASYCRVELSAVGSAVVLSVADDGNGGSEGEGSGLTGMRARVAAHGGQFVRERVGGTRLTITIPARAGRGGTAAAQIA